MKTVGKIVLAGVILMVLFIGGCTALVAGVSSEAEKDKSESLSKIEEGADKEKAKGESESAKPEPEPTEEDDPYPTLTTAEENAAAQALSYLDYSAFSRSGLVDQLVFEDYKRKDAEFVVKVITEADLVDWKKQAVRKAKSYLEYSNFSKPELVEQLEFEGFTPEQAQHGANVAYK